MENKCHYRTGRSFNGPVLKTGFLMENEGKAWPELVRSKIDARSGGYAGASGVRLLQYQQGD